MRLEKFIKEGRSQSTDWSTAIELLAKRCRNSLYMTMKNDSFIYRGVTGKRDVMTIDPKSGDPRASRNTSNFYTLWHDNTSTMKHFPKRSRSIICSTNYNKTKGYGNNTYVTFPENGANIGVVKSRDIFDIGYKGPINKYLGAINNILYDIFYMYFQTIKKHGITKFKISQPFDLDWKKQLEFQKAINFVHSDLEIAETFLELVDIHIEDRYFGVWKASGYNIDKWWQMNIPKSEFDLKKAGDDLSGYRDSEVWTDGFCVLVDVNTWEDDEFQKELRESL